MIAGLLTLLNRPRHMLAQGGALLALVMLMPTAQAQSELTFVSWGGAYTRSQMLAYVRPYQSSTDTRVNVEDYNGGLADLRKLGFAATVGQEAVMANAHETFR